MNKRELIKLLKQNGGKAPPAAGTTWQRTHSAPV